MPPGEIDKLHLRAPAGGETVSFSPGWRRGIVTDQVHVRVEPDDQLDAGYYEAFARLDPQSLGRLLHWLQTGEALERNDERIPEPFGGSPTDGYMAADVLASCLEEVARWDSEAASRHGNVGVREYAAGIARAYRAGRGQESQP